MFTLTHHLNNKAKSKIDDRPSGILELDGNESAEDS
jgi:hypothetical protein